ncbi:MULTISPECIES: hypothetical protein [Pacificimonas]|uniref:Uncharacterized protein n=1 Tax=Pacificimonas aurantium TaxID=1250540 RepID=A0ABS7WKS2_9SPHN|nr:MULTISPECIES: hypothetical protein [Pacificimonas]MBZ6378213.1 hypothetical protein [Pacificimonas aurantium]
MFDDGFWTEQEDGFAGFDQQADLESYEQGEGGFGSEDMISLPETDEDDLDADLIDD